ncbi:MAG: hypothetical protein IT458_18585 [Planctomycetes bacterium]|nr:hypothetical protein [Planctomycetota bacterium]
MRATAPLLLLPLLAAPAGAQLAWTQRFPAASPTPAARVALAHDAARQRTVAVLAGRNGMETWEWNGTTWALRNTGAMPLRSDTTLAYDSARQRTVLFGGGGRNDTWEWDGTAWSQKTPASAPLPRSDSASAYLPGAGVVVFGGKGGGAVLGDHWSWDGTTWRTLAIGILPPARSGHALGADLLRGRLLLHGGAGGAGPLGDTWAFDGKAWGQVSTAATPGPRDGHALAYDEARGRCVLYGGRDGSGTLLGDTWEFDGSQWHALQRVGQPGARAGHGMAFDQRRNYVVLCGGADATGPRNDTWEYGTGAMPAYVTYGKGCAGAAGTPLLAAPLGSLPYLGQRFTVSASGLPLQGSAVMLVGASRTQWGSLDLPLALDRFGAPGCTLYVEGLLQAPLQVSSGSALFTVGLPLDRNMAGLRFHQQVVALDRAANALGVILSNAGQATVGL